MQVFGISDIGLKRKSNQDVFYYVVNKFNECFAFVCDGMGGQNGGDIASRIVFDIFSKNISKILDGEKKEEEIKSLILNFYEKANREIYQKSYEKEELKGMGTTCTTVFVKKKKIFIFSVGDSRLYIKKDDFLKQQTVDHSYVQTLVDCGKITKEEAKFHPRKNEITKAVGILKEINVDFKEVEIFDGSDILLCTDGLTNSCSDLEINRILNKDCEIEYIAKELINLSKFNGGQDNVTVVLIRA